MQVRHLFLLNATFAAAPETYYTGRAQKSHNFNSGVMLLRPSAATFHRMARMAPSAPSYDKTVSRPTISSSGPLHEQ